MSFGLIDLLFNIVVMLFWFRLWNRDSRLAQFNPYLSGIENVTEPVIALFRPLFRNRADTFAAGAAWLILILFRAMALPWVNLRGIQSAWQLHLGFVGITPNSCELNPFPLFLLFSILSFAIFLFQIWAFALLFLKGYQRGMPSDRAPEFLYAIARPFSDARPRSRPWILLGYGMLVIWVMHFMTLGWALTMSVSGMASVLTPLRYAVATMAGAVDLLAALRALLFILIICSWISMFIGSNPLMMICREWLDFLLGPFRRFPLRIGPVDLTPIIAFFAIGIIHWATKGLLAGIYVKLLMIGI